MPCGPTPVGNVASGRDPPPRLAANSGVIILDFSRYIYKYAVLRDTGYGYRRDDGIYVLPIGSLKP